MAKIGSLLIDLEANVAQLQKDFRHATGIVDGAVKTMTKSVVSFGAAAAAYFASDRVVSWGKSVVDAGSAVQLAAGRIGIGTEALQELRYAGSLTGVGMREMDVALEKLTVKASQALSGNRELAGAFDLLGVKLTDTNDVLKPTDELFAAVADGLSKLPSDSQRAAVAVKLMEESGIKLVNTMRDGSAGLAEMRKEARDLGVVTKADAVAQMDALSTSFGKINAVIDGVSSQVMSALVPALLDLVKSFDMSSDGTKLFVEGLTFGFKLVATGGLIVFSVIEGLIRNLGTMVTMAKKLLSGDISGAWDTLNERAVGIFEDIEARLRTLKAIWTEQSKAADKAATKTTTVVGKVVKTLGDASKAAREMGERIADSFRRIQGIEASMTKTRVDDIRAGYAQQYAALQRQLEDEKLAQEEAAQIVREMQALQAKERAEIGEAMVAEAKAARRAIVDQQLETNAAIAAATKDRIDDLNAAMAQEAEAIRRRMEDNLLDRELGAQQLQALEQRTQREITDLHADEDKKRAEKAKKTAEATASYAGGAISSLMLAPLQDGFKGVADILDTVKGIFMDLIRRIVANAAIFALLSMVNPAEAGVMTVGRLLGFADGGYIDGAGTGTSDSNVVAVSNGEFIMRAAAVDRYGADFFAALNDMELPRFAGGGLVGGDGGGGTHIDARPTVVVRALDPADAVAVIRETIGPATTQRIGYRQGDRDMQAIARATQPKRAS